jgi:hypothetical protein
LSGQFHHTVKGDPPACRTIGTTPPTQGLTRIPQSAFLQLPSLTALALVHLDTTPEDIRGVFMPLVALQKLYAAMT